MWARMSLRAFPQNLHFPSILLWRPLSAAVVVTTQHGCFRYPIRSELFSPLHRSEIQIVTNFQSMIHLYLLRCSVVRLHVVQNYG